MTRLADRIVTSPGAVPGEVAVRVRRPGSELTHETTGQVQRISSPGEVFYLWRTSTGVFGTTETFTRAVLTTARHIEETAS